LTPVGLAGAAPREEPGDEAVPLVAEGDVLIIGLKDGRKLEGRLGRVGSDSIEVRSEGGRASETLQKDQVVSIEQRRFSKIKTVLLVAGITLGLYAYAYAKAVEGLLSAW
jgi:hypothetical protein